ncbi:MAG: hypothetical protein WBP10_18120 [Thermoanaerobaculia bacterium]
MSPIVDDPLEVPTVEDTAPQALRRSKPFSPALVDVPTHESAEDLARGHPFLLGRLSFEGLLQLGLDPDTELGGLGLVSPLFWPETVPSSVPKG